MDGCGTPGTAVSGAADGECALVSQQRTPASGLLGSHGHTGQADAGGREAGAGDRGREADEADFADTGGGQAFAVEEDDFDLGGVNEAGNAVPGKEWIEDFAVGKEDLLEEGAADGLDPMPGTTGAPFLPRGRYVLVQKNHTFLPHLQVIPVGGIVAFPNQDPFFHNVFSLFDGKRFNLGHYEAGSSRSVAFTRAGVSYIFCNIHPEMSAVIIALNTPLYAIADAQDTLVRRPIPPGDYRMHVWIEGVPPSFLEQLTRTVRLGSGMVDLGTVRAPIAPVGAGSHTNMYGKPYAPEAQSPYSDLP